MWGRRAGRWEALFVPITIPKYSPRTVACKSLAGNGISLASEGAVEVSKPPIRVVDRQHDFPKCYRLGPEGPPAYEEGRAEREQQVHGAGLGPHAEGEHGPHDERCEGQQESGEHVQSPRWCVG